MRKQTIITAVTIILLTAAIMLWSISRKNVLKCSGETTSPPKDSGVLSGMPPTDGIAAPATNPMRALMRSPIEFYGVVLDQDGNPVPTAKISASAVNNMLKASPISAITDAGGRFTIKSKGISLHIEVSKSGYYYVEKGGALKPSSQGFDFGVDNGKGVHHPNPSSPTVFHLRKSGNPVQLDVLRAQSRVPRDGSPITLGLSKTGNVTLKISCRTMEDSTQLPNVPYDWRCEIVPEGGGIQEVKDEHMFMAPLDGYVQLALIDMPKNLDSKQWSSRASKRYWLRFSDNTFGKVGFTMIAGGDHYALINGFRNPTPNDRNLEPKPDAR